MEHFQEEIIVLFHAAFIGRADVAQVSALSQLLQLIACNDAAVGS